MWIRKSLFSSVIMITDSINGNQLSLKANYLRICTDIESASLLNIFLITLVSQTENTLK